MILYRIIIFSFLFLCVFSNSIFSQDGIINGKDDYSFVEGLAQSGYFDFAEDLVGKMESSSVLSYSQKKRVKRLKCSLMQIKAQRELDPTKRKEKFTEAIECVQALVKSEIGIEKLLIQQDLGDMLIKQGQNLITRAEDKDSMEKEKLHQESNELLKQALAIFLELKTETDRAGYELAPRNKSDRERRRVQKAEIRYHSWYGVCRALYFLGLTGEDTLTRCQQELEAYIWDYEGKIGSFYALLLRGMVLHELKQYKKAVESYDAVLKNLIKIEHPKAKLLSMQGCYYKMKTYIKWGRFTTAIDSIKDFRADLTKYQKADLAKEEFGDGIMLELGKAYVGTGEYKKAIDIAQKIAQKMDYWGFAAKKLLEDWGKLNPASLESPETAYLVATGLFRQNKYQQAILSFLKVTQYSKTKSDIEKYGLDSWEKLGQSFWGLELYQEAALCYEKCATKFKNLEKEIKIDKKIEKISIAAKSAYWSYRSYRESYKISKDAGDDNDAKRMRNYLVENWPSSTYAYNLSYSRAEDGEIEAENTKDIAQKIQKYRDVADLYRKVDKSANLYERAFVNVGICYYKAAEIALEQKGFKLTGLTPDFEIPNDIKKDYSAAGKELSRYLYYASKNTINKMDLERKTRRQQSMAQALFYLGKVYMRLGNLDRSYNQYKKVYDEYSEESEMVCGAIFLMSRILLKKSKLEEAEELLKGVEKKYKDIKLSDRGKAYLSFVYYLVGKKYEADSKELDKALETLKTKEETKEVKSKIESLTSKKNLYVEKSAQYLYEWLRRKYRPSGSLYDWVGSKLVITGDLFKKDNPRKANQYYTKALELFEKYLAIAKDKGKIKEIKQKIGNCALRKSEWETSIYTYYPLYHKDKDLREVKRKEELGKYGRGTVKTSREDPAYIDNISKILIGVAEMAKEKELKDYKKLYFFLIKTGRRDVKEDFEDFISQAGTKTVYEQYAYLEEVFAWLNDSKLEDEEKRRLKEEFEGVKEELKAKSQLGDIIVDLRNYYKSKFSKLLDKKLPSNPENYKTFNSLKKSQIYTRVYRLAIHLAYDFTSKLVENVPKYKNKKISFGFYDNPVWWEMKYRQIYLIYLRGEKERTRNLIGALRMQQKRLGGEEYKQKFLDLLDKCK